MQRTLILVAVLLAVTAIPSLAELQNVEVGGSVRIRGNYIHNTFTTGLAPQVRWPAATLAGRSIGGPFNPNVSSIFDWDNRGTDVSFVEQRTRLDVKADFTDQVSAFIELDSYDNWGEDFRSSYVTGADGRGHWVNGTGSVDDVEVFQAYVEANEMYGYPLRLRVGRQELAFGSQFLVGPRDFAFFYTGISFDAVRLTYATDQFTVDAFWSKLNEAFSDFAKDDVDFYGIYASYTGIEDMVIDAYWLMLQDETPFPEDTASGLVGEWFEDVWGIDDYDKTTLHTVGLRAAGTYGAFDYDAEVAYQFGEADIIGRTFNTGIYGDDSADFSNWALKLDVGYAFDVKYHPHVFLGFRYFGGEDNRDLSFWDWVNPFDKPEASISFNRLFSNQIQSGFVDLNNDLSNAWVLFGGVEGAITEKLLARFCVNYYETVDAFDAPAHFTWNGRNIAIAPWLPFWTEENDSYMGTEVYLFMEYHYSEDLIFEVGWTHLFVGDGLEEGSYSRWNGLLFNGGTDDDGADYIYGGCKLYF